MLSLVVAVAALGAVALSACNIFSPAAYPVIVPEPDLDTFDYGAFPKSFFWAAATSHHQAEGNDIHSDWWAWEQAGKTKSGDLSGIASDHWNRYEEDLDLLSSLNCDAYRMSLNWAALFPNGPDEHDESAAQHYDEVFAAMRVRGIRPIVTLHHFCMPQWLTAADRWSTGEAIGDFAKFAYFCARRWGGEVDYWVTMNEPEVYAFHGWLRGVFPPGKIDLGLATTVYFNLMKAHAEGYHAIKNSDAIDADGDGATSMVGIAKLMVPVQPASVIDPIETLAAGFLGDFSNAYWLVANQTGILEAGNPLTGRPVHEYPPLKNSLDFIGVNYYSRQIINIEPIGGLMIENPVGNLVSELGIELYPQGLYDSLALLAPFELPLMVTENGIADSTDVLRGRFIHSHLRTLARFMRDRPDVPILGYVHWALMDNFEWENGFKPRFGLYEVDYSNQQRLRRPSADLFAEIIRRVKAQ